MPENEFLTKKLTIIEEIIIKEERRERRRKYKFLQELEKQDK